MSKQNKKKLLNKKQKNQHKKKLRNFPINYIKQKNTQKGAFFAPQASSMP